MKRVVILLAFLLTACSSAVENEAEAYTIHNRSDIEVAQAKEALNLQQQINETEIRAAQRNQEISDAVQDATTSITKIIIWVGGISIALVLFSMGIGLSWASILSGKAVGQGALLRSTLITMDKNTGMFPIKVISNEEKVRSLVDANKRTVMLPDVALEPDALMVASSAAVQHAQVVTNNAKNSKDPDGVTRITPLVIDAKEIK